MFPLVSCHRQSLSSSSFHLRLSSALLIASPHPSKWPLFPTREGLLFNKDTLFSEWTHVGDNTALLKLKRNLDSITQHGELLRCTYNLAITLLINLDYGASRENNRYAMGPLLDQGGMDYLSNPWRPI